MIKCEIIDNVPQYLGAQPHIVFYKNDRGTQYAIATPYTAEGIMQQPDEVKRILNRNFEIFEVYAVEPDDVSILRGMYAAKSIKS